MNPQSKYDECLALLAEIHEICHMMIEAGMDEGLTPYDLIEEAVRVLRAVDGSSPVASTSIIPPKKEKKILH
jgi:hypothetical protein